MVCAPDENCVLWDLDKQVGVKHPWGVPAERVSAVLARIDQDGAPS